MCKFCLIVSTLTVSHLHLINSVDHTMMNFNSTESWFLINASFPLPSVIVSPANTSGMEAYLQRLAHLDEGLYNDFYGLWIALMVINSLIFLVGSFYCLFLHFISGFGLLFLFWLCLPGGHGAQHGRTLRLLFSYQAKEHLSDLHH